MNGMHTGWEWSLAKVRTKAPSAPCVGSGARRSRPQAESIVRFRIHPDAE